MWTAETEPFPGGMRFVVRLGPWTATFADAIRGWQEDADFRALFNGWLTATPFAAFRWEMPALTDGTLRRPFEFVLLDAPGLDRRPDPVPFAGHFPTAKDGVAVFVNLGGDATLVVPSPAGDPSAYGHLAAFVRSAPPGQRDCLWRAVGAALARRVGPSPVWLSTAGAGVPWLHVRLDDRPKYYGYAPYRTPPAA
jgi:hypothetical protein